MSRPNYRVLLSYDSERKVFVARIPEWAPCTGEGATRSEALLNMERELEALLHNVSESGGYPPQPIDDKPMSGDLSIKVSHSLQRDLGFQAQVEGVELNQLVAEILAAGLEHRQRSGRPPRRPHPNEQPAGEASGNRNDRGDSRPQDNRWRGPGNRDERGSAARLHGMLEDRASFMEYVRGLEQDGGHNQRGPRNNGPNYDNRGGGRRGPPQQGQGGGRGDRPPYRGPGGSSGGNRPPGGSGGGGGGSSGGSGGGSPGSTGGGDGGGSGSAPTT